ncbi:MAG TPA: DUF6056 family protein [Bacteroidia bacterium]|nr:DUF6056 family protein [Bacteroidia bacterium]
MPMIILVLMAASNFLFIRELFCRHLGRLEEITISLFFTLLFLHQMPVLSEGIYWFTGVVTYQLATVFIVLYTSLLLSYTNGRIIFKNRRIHIFILTVFLITCIGFNEIYMIALVSFACISLFIVKKNKLKNEKFFSYIFFVTLLFAAVMFFAPGNDVRASQASNNHRFLSSVIFSIAQTIRFFLEWTSSLPLLISSTCYYFINKKLATVPLFSSSFYLNPFYSVLLLFFVIFIAVFPPYWTTGILGQHRTVNVGYFLFLIVWFINLTVFFNRYKKELQVTKDINQQVGAILMCLLLVSLFFTKNGYDVLNDIFYKRAADYDLQMKKRYELMNTTKDTIFFDPIIDPPKTLFLYDITNDPNDWLNRSYTLYFNCKNKVLVKK